MRFHFADCVLDADRFELARSGRPVAVQPKVLNLLLVLLRQPERTVTKQELLDALWPGTATSESSLTRAVSFARDAVGERDGGATVIRTVRGRGYRIGVPVRAEAPEAQAAPAANGFLCREKELALARDVLHEALAGRGQMLLLVGEPGIGKTRLAAELERVARERGALVLWGRCHAGESERAYGPWLQILRAGIAAWGADSVAALGEDAAAELAALLPELRRQLPELPPASGRSDAARRLLFDAFGRLLAGRAAAAPLVLVLDDLHGADEPSLRLLAALGQGLERLCILLVGTYRELPVGQPHPLASTLAELARAHPPRRHVMLRGLEPGCVRRFIAQHTGLAPSPALVDACHRRSEGNPLFLVELLHWLETQSDGCGEPPPDFERQVPEGIRQVIRGRLGALPEDCRHALAGAAALGREFPVAVLARALALDRETLLSRLAEAEAAHVLEPVSGSAERMRFAHTLIRETLYEDLPSLGRARLHLALGEALEELYRPRPLVPTRSALPIHGTHLAELAHHFAAALPVGSAGKALDYCEGAGAHALSLLAFEQAARHLDRALEVLDATAPADEARRARLAAARARAAAGAVAS
jgi:predicted ATPase